MEIFDNYSDVCVFLKLDASQSAVGKANPILFIYPMLKIKFVWNCKILWNLLQKPLQLTNIHCHHGETVTHKIFNNNFIAIKLRNTYFNQFNLIYNSWIFLCQKLVSSGKWPLGVISDICAERILLCQWGSSDRDMHVVTQEARTPIGVSGNLSFEG